MYDKAIEWAKKRYPKEHRYMMRLWQAAWKISKPISIAAICVLAIPGLVAGFIAGKMMTTTNIYMPDASSKNAPLNIGQNQPSPPSQRDTSTAASPSKAPPLRQDRERMNEALSEIHGIIKTKLQGSIGQFHGNGVQRLIFNGPPVDGYGPILEIMKQRSSEIEADEKEIDAVFAARKYAYLNDELRQVITPSRYRARGEDGVDLQRNMQDFLDALGALSQKFPKPDSQIHSILVNQGNKLEPQLFKYTAWANETVAKIEAEQKKLRQQ